LRFVSEPEACHIRFSPNVLVVTARKKYRLVIVQFLDRHMFLAEGITRYYVGKQEEKGKTQPTKASKHTKLNSQYKLIANVKGAPFPRSDFTNWI
jgi:hypothetical protein